MEEDPKIQNAQVMMRYDARKKSAVVAYLLWFFFGTFGIHRLYLGRILSGIIFLLLTLAIMLIGLLTLGAGMIAMAIPGLWWLVDLFLIHGIVERHNQNLAETIAGASRAGL